MLVPLCSAMALGFVLTALIYAAMIPFVADIFDRYDIF